MGAVKRYVFQRSVLTIHILTKHSNNLTPCWVRDDDDDD